MEINGQSWFFLALIAPILWAGVNLLDNYFVADVYEDAFDGAIISGIFQLLPWILVLFGIITLESLAWDWVFVALFAGATFSFAMFFYFKTLFTTNDTVLTQIFWNTSLFLVPFFSWIVLDEILQPIHYGGILLAFIGTTLIIGNYRVDKREVSQICIFMGLSTIFLSLSLVFSKQAYVIGGVFWPVYLFFALGNVVGSVVLLLFDRKPALERLRGIAALSRGFLVLFLCAESLQLIGALTSQGAIDASPSPSFVAVVESTLPAFVLIMSAFLVWLLPRFSSLKDSSVQKIYTEQLSGLPLKLFSIILMSIGVYFIT